MYRTPDDWKDVAREHRWGLLALALALAFTGALLARDLAPWLDPILGGALWPVRLGMIVAFMFPFAFIAWIVWRLLRRLVAFCARVE